MYLKLIDFHLSGKMKVEVSIDEVAGITIDVMRRLDYS